MTRDRAVLALHKVAKDPEDIKHPLSRMAGVLALPAVGTGVGYGVGYLLKKRMEESGSRMPPAVAEFGVPLLGLMAATAAGELQYAQNKELRNAFEAFKNRRARRQAAK